MNEHVFAHATQPCPKGWPRITASIFYDDPAAAIDWLCRVFGFRVRMKVEGEGGSIIHAELDFGADGLVMVGPAGEDGHGLKRFAASPRTVAGLNTQCVAVMIDDADAHCAHAEAAGATVTMRPETQDYGEDYWVDRTYQAEDLEGHRWWFIQRMRGEAVRASR